MKRYPRHIRKEAELAEKMNWTLVHNKHLKWFDQKGVLRLTTSMTPHKGKRSTLNARAVLKRCGIVA